MQPQLFKFLKNEAEAEKNERQEKRKIRAVF